MFEIKLNKKFIKYKVSKEYKPSILYAPEIFFTPKLFNRIICLAFTKNKKIVKNWLVNNNIGKWAFNKLLSFTIFKYDFFLKKNVFIFFCNFLKSKKIHLGTNDIVLFGPWPHIYYHQIIDFILRLILLKTYNYDTIYVPENLKNVLLNKPFKKIFKNFKIVFYTTNKKIIFYNVKYLTHIQQSNKNYYLSSTILNLNKAIHNNYFLKKNKTKHILVSRKGSSRKLLNEDELYEKLKKYGFKRFYFEELSIYNQIEISFNSKIMIGYHGSGLTNSIFMKPNSHVIDIVNKYYQNPGIKILCMNSKINYIKSICETNNKDLGGVCNIDLLENKIKSII